MPYSVLYTIVFIPYIFLIGYYAKAWKSIPKTYRKNTGNELPFISVIIPARNEAARIGDCLDTVIDQDYPAHLFEVIVVDDYSDDNTAAIIQSAMDKHAAIRLVSMAALPGFATSNSFKKKAIAAGIAFAKGTLIVTTDADCLVSNSWLSAISHRYAEEQPGMIAGPVMFSVPRVKNPFQKLFYIFQALDFMTLQGITGAAIHKKFHYMANGANLAYSKALFQSINGFEGIDRVASGDDMLLMEKIGFGNHISYLKDKEAIVRTTPEPTMKSFVNQRIRWAGKTSAYSNKTVKWVMALVYLANLFIVVVAIAAFFSTQYLLFFLVIFGVKILIDLSFLVPVASFFGQKNLLWWFPVIQLLHLLYILVAGWLGIFGGYTWKGRHVR